MTARRFATVAVSTVMLTAALPLLPLLTFGSPAAAALTSAALHPSTLHATALPPTSVGAQLSTTHLRTAPVSTRLFRASARTTTALRPAGHSLARPAASHTTIVAPHSTIRIAGTVKSRRAARVTLQRRAGGTTTFRPVRTVRTPASARPQARTFAFAAKIGKSSNNATFRVRVRTSHRVSYATVGRFSQHSSPDALNVTTGSPSIVESGAQHSPEAADAAGRLLQVTWTTGVHPRVAILQHRPTSSALPGRTSTWRDVESSSTLPARSTGQWTPSTPMSPGMEYRAAYRYSTGISTTSAIAVPAPARLLFSDEFTGTALDPALWSARREGNRCNFQAPGTATVAVGGGVARLTPRIMAGSEPAVSCGGCFVPGNLGATSRSQCMEVPHIVTTERVAVPRPGTGVWMAARVRLQQGSDGEAHGGSHSAFWFNAGYCRGGEVDIFEYMGDHRLADAEHPESRGAVAYKQYDLSTCDGHGTMDKRALTLLEAPVEAPGRAWSDQYTIFALRWTQTRESAEFTLYVDGRRVATSQGRRVTTPDVGGMVLSNFVSDYENRGAASVKDSTLYVDWVRAWSM